MSNFWIRQNNGLNTLKGIEDTDNPPVLPLYIIAEFLRENPKAREDFPSAYSLLEADEKARLDEMLRDSPRSLIGDEEPQIIEDRVQTKLNDTRVNLPVQARRVVEGSNKLVVRR